MQYQCSVCDQKVEGDALKFIEHTEVHIMEEIRKKHPEWQDKDGLCPKCEAYFRSQLKGEQ